MPEFGYTIAFSQNWGECGIVPILCNPCGPIYPRRAVITVGPYRPGCEMPTLSILWRSRGISRECIVITGTGESSTSVTKKPLSESPRRDLLRNPGFLRTSPANRCRYGDSTTDQCWIIGTLFYTCILEFSICMYRKDCSMMPFLSDLYSSELLLQFHTTNAFK